MVKEIRWTTEATDSFNRIIEYLLREWSEREVENFVTAVDKVIEYISNHPRMFRKTNRKNVREALVTPHNLLIYKIMPSHIDLLTFWDTRQHPKKKKW
ncbi:MAG: type II toxin-antitoxin system RelE/ParE family toxin [Bacteroidia bacterium]